MTGANALFEAISMYGTQTAAVVLSGLALSTSVAALFARRALAQAQLRQKEMMHAALHDELTGLPNRKTFMAELARISATAPETAVIFLDLDGFKCINDSLGHATGDAFLKASALRLRRVVGDFSGCVLARVGGDEFAIALPGPGARHAAAELADRLVAEIRKPIAHEGRDLVAGTSIGIAIGDRSVRHSDLLRRADLAMYEAKRTGGAGWAMFDSRLAALHSQREDLITAISDSIALANSLPVNFLPVKTIADGEITSVGLELSWPEPYATQAPARSLLEYAAEENIGFESGNQLLQRASMEARRLPGLRIAIPLSVRQVQSPDFESQLEEALIRSGACPKSLELQFPASQLSQLARRSTALLLIRLADRGVNLALTGFGRGPSDIAMLEKSPFKRLIVHESLTRNIADDLATQRLVQGIAAIARSHGLEVAAREVASENEARLLRLAGISEMSGPAAGKPASAEVIRRLTRSAARSLALA